MSRDLSGEKPTIVFEDEGDRRSFLRYAALFGIGTVAAACGNGSSSSASSPPPPRR